MRIEALQNSRGRGAVGGGLSVVTEKEGDPGCCVRSLQCIRSVFTVTAVVYLCCISELRVTNAAEEILR